MGTTITCTDYELEAARAASATPPPVAAVTPAPGPFLAAPVPEARIVPQPIAFVARTIDDTLRLGEGGVPSNGFGANALTPVPHSPHHVQRTTSSRSASLCESPIGIGAIVAGKYRIDAKLGDGATAVVWQARD